MTEDPSSFWEVSKQVERFAGREPDRRLLRLIESYEEPARVRVLDLGCAGGRNTVVIVERGFDVYAVDASRAMVERTRSRVAELLGREAAQQRVRLGRMGSLAELGSGSFDLVVALGVYHNASSREEWERALSETERLLRPGGLVLVANFSPRSDPRGEGLDPVPGAPHLYEGFEAGRMYLMEANLLDAEMARHGLLPAVATETVEAPTETGRRVTVNGLYRKGAS